MQDKKRVMIVEDAAMMRIVIKNVLDGDDNLAIVGYAANGKEALEKLPSLHPDLILLDIEMPEMDGLEFLRHARLKSRAKVVVLTSVAPVGSPKAVKARTLGANAVISKPSGAISYDLKQKRGSQLMQTIYDVLDLTR